MYPDPSGRGWSRGRLSVAGVAMALSLSGVVALLGLRYAGHFEETVAVTALMTSTGDGLPARADVRFRGLLVGMLVVLVPGRLRIGSLDLPVAAYLTGQYGVNDLYVGVPVVLGAGGVERIVEIALDETEKAGFAKSCDAVRSLVQICKDLDAKAAS